MLPAYRFVGQIRQFGRPFLKNMFEDAMISNVLQYENCKFLRHRQSSARHEPEKEGLPCNRFHFCLQRRPLSLIEWVEGTSELDAFLNLLD